MTITEFSSLYKILDEKKNNWRTKGLNKEPEKAQFMPNVKREKTTNERDSCFVSCHVMRPTMSQGKKTCTRKHIPYNFRFHHSQNTSSILVFTLYFQVRGVMNALDLLNVALLCGVEGHSDSCSFSHNGIYELSASADSSPFCDHTSHGI